MLRGLALLIVTWLAHKYTIALVVEHRVRNGADAIARGQRWEGFLLEEGGLGDMIVKLRREYFEAYGATGMSDTAKQYEYALADRLLRQLDREARTIVETGKLRANEQAFAARNAAITR